MPDLKVHVHETGGDTHEVEAPSNISTEEFIRELVLNLNLTKTDANGHDVRWTIDNKNTGMTLSNQKSLAEEGVQTGHHLYLRRQVDAGSLDPRVRIGPQCKVSPVKDSYRKAG
jgi:hypothetical protein